ncbi:MAG: hypothetical protein HYR91_01655 [Flavobacteriia bacterium]|nr:hypothetical protein [Flavobacteriia bacterium]
MNVYNNLMLKFWLIVAIIIPVIVTYLGITDGFKKWGGYYILSIIALFMYLIRKWMMKRMAKHLQYLSEQKNKE